MDCLCGHFAVLPKEKDKKIIPRNRPCPFLRKFGRPLCRPIVIIVGSNVEWIKESRWLLHTFVLPQQQTSYWDFVEIIFFLFWLLLLLLCELVITFDIWKSTILFSCKTEKKIQESSCYFSELLDAFVFISFASAIFEKILTGSRGNRQANWNLDNFLYWHAALGKWAFLMIT